MYKNLVNTGVNYLHSNWLAKGFLPLTRTSSEDSSRPARIPLGWLGFFVVSLILTSQKLKDESAFKQSFVLTLEIW